MRKIYSCFKGVAAVALLCAAGTTAQAVTLQKGTTYKFTCDYELKVADEAANLLGGEFEFTVTNPSSYQFQLSNFVSTLFNGRNNSQDGNEIPLWQKFGDFNDHEGLAFSDASGIYPFGTPENAWKDVYVVLTLDDEGNLTIPDFTVGRYSQTLDENEDIVSYTWEVVATYSNCEATLVSGGVDENAGNTGGDEKDERSYSGTYTFEGTCVDYSGDEPVTTTDSFQFVVNEWNEPGKMFGYKLQGPLSNGSISYTATDNSYTVTGGCIVETGNVSTGGNSLYIASPNVDNITGPYGFSITVNDDGTYSISNFTVWEGIVGEDMQTVTGYKLRALWTEMKCVSFEELSNGTEGGSPFAGTYTGQIDLLDYSTDSWGVEKYDQDFSFVVSLDNELVSICGYTPVEPIVGVITESETETLLSFPWNLNTYVQDADGKIYGLSNNSAWDDEEEGSISVYLDEEGNFRIGAFSIWSVDGDYRDIITYYYGASGLEFEKEEAPITPSEFVGTYTGKVDILDFTTDSFGVEKYNQDFSIVINESNEIESICGYTPLAPIRGTVSESETDTIISFPWNISTMVKDAEGNIYNLTSNSPWDDEEEGLISLYKSDEGTYRMGAFSLWTVDGTDRDIYIYYYTADNLTFDGDTSGVTVAPVVNSDKVEYYNLQGVKVANPSNGIFIRIQGNKSTKVIVK